MIYASRIDFKVLLQPNFLKKLWLFKKLVLKYSSSITSYKKTGTGSKLRYLGWLKKVCSQQEGVIFSTEADTTTRVVIKNNYIELSYVMCVNECPNFSKTKQPKTFFHKLHENEIRRWQKQKLFGQRVILSLPPKQKLKTKLKTPPKVVWFLLFEMVSSFIFRQVIIFHSLDLG